MDVPSSILVEEISIYSIRTHRQRNIILAVLALIAFLLPFCDTVYLPALNIIKIDLKTSDTLVLIGVSIYFISGALSGIIWGQASDRFGRKIILLVALISFSLVTIGCIFSPNIIVFLILRSLEGASVSATLVIGQSLVADMYPEEVRGSALGLFFIPFNIGPILGPLIGGPLCGVFGWRSTFVFLAVYSVLALIALVFLVPETHQYFARENYQKSNPNKRIIDAMPDVLMPFQNIFRPLTYLFDLKTIPFMIVASTMLATLIVSLTLFSFYLQQTPYNYGPATIGLLYLPSGISLLTGSLFGGWISDKASKYFGYETCPEGRLVPTLLLSIINSVGLVIFGWTFQYNVNVIGPIIGQMLIALGQSVFESSISAYLTSIKQAEAAGVSAANNCLNFCIAGILLSFTIPIQNALGRGVYFSLLGIINIITIMWAGILVYKSIQRSRYVSIS